MKIEIYDTTLRSGVRDNEKNNRPLSNTRLLFVTELKLEFQKLH